MNKDFPRLLTVLRKERGLSQKQVAADLKVTQALLSHYENGKRECGLDFLVNVADYYGVSTDFLLGRSHTSSGATITEEQLPESTVSEKYDGAPSGMPVFLYKKLITNTVEVVFSLLIKAKNTDLAKAVSNYLILAVYRAYRMVYSTGGKNNEQAFSIPHADAAGLTNAAMAVQDVKAGAAATANGTQDEPITTPRIEQQYPQQAAALQAVIKNSETLINKLN